MTDHLVVVAEVKGIKKKRDPALVRCGTAIKNEVQSHLGLVCSSIVLIVEKTIVKTSSGKIARQPTKNKLLADGFEVLWQHHSSDVVHSTGKRPCQSRFLIARR